MVRSTDIEQVRIDEMLMVYRELQSQFDRVRDRLRRADEHKHTVNRRIFDRVRSEYDRELDSIRAKMSPIRDEVDQLQASLEEQLREAAGQLESIEEELSEAKFRHLVGEYISGDFDTVQATLDLRASDARARCEALKSALEAIATMKTPEPNAPPAEVDAFADEPVAEPTAATPPEPVAEPAPRRPVLNAAGLKDSLAGFENPQEWLAEMGRDAARPERLGPISPVAPSTQGGRAADQAAGVAAMPRTTAPSLVFVGGAHAGQSIALLPTTLTIGREHDNNVEIKDPDVARYHARIMNERGSYVVEDMDSSTGTWVNGQRTRRATLAHGDVIRVGQTELAFDCEWTAASRR